jgi:hypothetical protein
VLRQTSADRELNAPEISREGHESGGEEPLC